MEPKTPFPLGTTGPEPLISRYRHWYAQERDANEKMLAALESVPESARGDARFARAVRLAAHLAACRENYHELLQGREPMALWWPEEVALDTLRPRYARLEAAWASYLDSLTDHTLTQNFAERGGDDRYLWNVEGQVFQLLGHAYYHRGQISLLVDELGGETVDTDYVEWVFTNNDQGFGQRITD